MFRLTYQCAREGLGDDADSSGDASVLDERLTRRATILPVAVLLIVPLLTVLQTGATPTTGAVVPLPPRTGVIVPLYTSSLGDWTPVVDAKAAHPGVPIVGIINPKGGPGSAPDSSYSTLVGQLRSAGIVVLGYSDTFYGQRNASAVEAEIHDYATWYNVSGVFLDQMAYQAGHESYYGSLTAYSRSLGLTMVVGNPGVDPVKGYAGTVDTIVIYENSGFPYPATLGGWHTGYPKTNWAILPYNVPSLDRSCVVSASYYVGYVYATDRTFYPSPWDSLPRYFGDLVATLDSPPAQLCLAIESQRLDGTPITGMWATVQGGGTTVAAGFTPLLYAATGGTQYSVYVADYKSLVFDHWADTGSLSRARTISVSADTVASAVFVNSSGPPPPGESRISIHTVNSTGASISGAYVTYWSNASILPGCTSPCSASQGFLTYCFSPCSIFLRNGATYYVAVADFDKETFSHWTDGTQDRFYKLVIGSASTIVELTAVFSP
jgi:hypothetical protein